MNIIGGYFVYIIKALGGEGNTLMIGLANLGNEKL